MGWHALPSSLMWTDLLWCWVCFLCRFQPVWWVCPATVAAGPWQMCHDHWRQLGIHPDHHKPCDNLARDHSAGWLLGTYLDHSRPTDNLRHVIIVWHAVISVQKLSELRRCPDHHRPSNNLGQILIVTGQVATLDMSWSQEAECQPGTCPDHWITTHRLWSLEA